MKITMKLHGFEDFSRKLNELPKKVENRVLQQATVSALKEHLTEMKAAAPIDENGRSPASKTYGRLRSNISVLQVRKPGRRKKAARFDTRKAFWGNFYELGTSKQAPRPFFGRKFREMSNSILSSLRKHIEAGIYREIK